MILWTGLAWALPFGLVDTPDFEAYGVVEHGAEVGPTVLDFDGDGDWDVLYVENADNGTDVFHLMIQEGPNLWVDEALSRGLVDLDSMNPVRAVLPADLDHDGLVDVVVVGTEDVTVFWNDGALFGAATLVTGGNREGAALVDVDRDGWLDVVVNDNDWLDLYRNEQGARTFQVSRLVTLPSGGTSFVTAADANHDGFTDLFVHADHNQLAWHADGLGGYVHQPSLASVDGLSQNIGAKGVMVACDAGGTGTTLAIMPTEGTQFPDAGTHGFYSWNGSAYGFDGQVSDLEQVRTATCGHFDADATPDVVFGGNLDAVVAEDQLVESSVADARALTLAPADLDDDGDLDLVVQAGVTRVEGIRLYDNQQTVDRDQHLQVAVRTRLTPCGVKPELSRPDWGAQVVLTDAGGTPVSDLQELQGGLGRGQRMWPVLHFAGVDPDAELTVRVFPMADRTGSTSPGGTGRGYVDVPGVVPSDHTLPGGAQRLEVTLPLCEPLDTATDTGPTDTATSPPTTGDTGDTTHTAIDTGDTFRPSDSDHGSGLTGLTGLPDTGPPVDSAVDPGDTGAPTDDGAATPADGKAAAGCACQSSSLAGPWWGLVVLGATVSRRRRSSRQGSVRR